MNRLLWHACIALISQWLSPNQHDFTHLLLTHSLVSFCDEAREFKSVTFAFLDIKTAFDVAGNPAIISTLAVHKCPRYLIQLIFGFLFDRTAILSLDGTSSSFHVGLGCFLGGVLSPFPWSVLVDDVLSLNFPFPSLIVG